MSVEAATRFVEHIRSDDEFLTKIVEAPDSKTRTEIAEAAGYSFEQDELEKALEQTAGTADDVADVSMHISMRYGAPSFYSDEPLDHDPFWNSRR